MNSDARHVLLEQPYRSLSSAHRTSTCPLLEKRPGRLRRLIVSLVVIALTFVLVGQSFATVFVDIDAPPGGDGNSWAGAYQTVQAGIDDADTLDEEVWVAEGTYAESITMKDGVAVYGGFDGTETLLSQRDIEANVTTIDASTADGGGPADHVVVMDSVTNSRIDGFRITGGYADGSGPHVYGGGFYCLSADNTNTIANCTISDNAAGDGGGVYCNASSPTISDCTISKNGGGGLVCEWSSSPAITDCAIIDNSGNSVGGITCHDSSPTITNCTITGNSASEGAGIRCASSSPAITSCNISGNSVAWWGGGVYCNNSAPTITSCTISGNSASEQGGGIGCYNGGSPVMLNCIISGNWAAERGGAVHCNLSSPTLTNCTIASNSAPTGGGVSSVRASAPTITNTILVDNPEHAIYEAASGADVTAQYCVFHDNPGGDYYDHEIGSLTGANDINMNVPEAMNNFGGDPVIVTGSTGTWSAAPSYNGATNRTTLIDSGASFSAGALVGGLVNANITQRRQAPITANTATTVEVVGDVTGYVESADSYQVIGYHLQDGSSALDRGDVAAAPPEDFEGDSRPGTDALVDIGADEAPSAYVHPPDTADPVSRVEGLPDVITTAVFSVPYLAGDAETGIQYVELYYRRGGGAWTNFGGTYTDSPVSFDSATTGGDGEYEFYTVATDNADNEEPPPSTADDSVVIITTSFIGPRVHVDKDATGTGLGTNWTNAIRRVQAGLAVADAFSVPEVWVAEGTYMEAITMTSGVALYGGFAGTEAQLSGRNVTANTTIIDASTATRGGPADHAAVMTSMSNARIDGFTITGADADGDDEDRFGAGIYCRDSDSTNTIANCTITGNSASAWFGYGAGIFCGNSSPAITNCTISSNSACGVAEGAGGGVYCISSSSPAFTDCTISGNSASGQDFGDGGGVFCNEGSSPTFSGCVISANSASGYNCSGGGVYCRNGSPTLTNCVISDNSVILAGWGGGCGGGIYCTDGSPTITNCTFASNSAEAYGGGAIHCTFHCAPVITNTIFYDNNQWAIYEGDFTSDAAVTHCLFHNNPDGDYMDVQTGSHTGAYDINTNVNGASDNIDGSPMFVNSAAGDYHLRYGSPCIDMGTDSGAPLTDIDGDPRPVDVAGLGAEGTGTEYDIGADEFSDSDGDGVSDYEDAFPRNPRGQTDSDGDGIGDEWEDRWFGNNNGVIEPGDLTTVGEDTDYDSDECLDITEFTHGSDPTDPLSVVPVAGVIGLVVLSLGILGGAAYRRRKPS